LVWSFDTKAAPFIAELNLFIAAAEAITSEPKLEIRIK
jgi:hypothetical protein